MVFCYTLDGVELEITADSFEGDESVGVPYGPEEVSAKRLDNGLSFELSDAQVEQLGVVAMERYYDSYNNDFD